MLEIGKARTVPVRKRIKGKLVPVGGEKTVVRQIWACTKDTLGGHFGPDRNRKLVVGLAAGDVLIMYPKGTRQRVSVLLTDVYGWALRCRAVRSQLEKARERKQKLAEQREARSRAQAERRLVRSARKDNHAP